MRNMSCRRRDSSHCHFFIGWTSHGNCRSRKITNALIGAFLSAANAGKPLQVADDLHGSVPQFSEPRCCHVEYNLEIENHDDIRLIVGGHAEIVGVDMLVLDLRSYSIFDSPYDAQLSRLAV